MGGGGPEHAGPPPCLLASRLDALIDYAARCNSNGKLRRTLENWSRLVHFSTLDTGEVFTVRIDHGEIVAFALVFAGHR